MYCRPTTAPKSHGVSASDLYPSYSEHNVIRIHGPLVVVQDSELQITQSRYRVGLCLKSVNLRLDYPRVISAAFGRLKLETKGHDSVTYNRAPVFY
jgi:hypothetical protein